MVPENPEYSIIVPVHNEEPAIGDFLDRLLEAVKGKNAEVIVVDDGSTDQTPTVLSIYQGEEDLRVFSHERNQGYGSALKTGLRQARAEKVAIIDGDGSYPPEKMPALLSRSPDAEMVVGARKGGLGKEPVLRTALKWMIGKLARWLSGFEIKDLNSGLRVFRKSVALKYLSLLPEGFSFTSTLTLIFLSDGFRVDYLEIDYQPRRGKSKFRLIELHSLSLLLLRTLLYFNPLKFFVPLSLLLFLLAISVAAVSIFSLHKFMDVTTVVLIIASIQTFILGLLADLILRLKK